MPRDLDQPRRSRDLDRFDPTRGRPEPWFVGSGRGLMIGVLAICAMLLVIRIASFLWLAESAWTWWNAPSTHPTLPPLAASKPAPPRRVPPPDPRKARSVVKGNPGQFFSADAYPPEALRAEEQGRTVADLLVDRTGTPTGCTIETSSGSRSLDAATCSIAIGKIRFDPARDKKGVAIVSHYRLPVRWVLPEG
jgi:TonB family protein